MNAMFVTLPHSGEDIPVEASWLKNLPEELLMRDVDRYVDALYDPIIEKLKLPSVRTRWHRYAIDLNRAAEDIDTDAVVGAPHPSGTFPRGLHWSMTTQRERLMPAPIPLELHQKLLQKYFEPFHQEVRATQRKLSSEFGENAVLYHLDLHSMPSLGTSEHRDPGERRKDIVVSDCKGQSCSAEFTKLVTECYQNAGFSVAQNWPYFGGRITEQYGRPQERHHSVQVELNRSLYMDEDTKQRRTDGAFEQIQSQLGAAIDSIYRHLGKQ